MGNSDKRKTAMEEASSYLAGRMRTVAEMRAHLKDKGYDESETEETVNDLIGLRYLDDYEYALRYYEYNASKHRGSRRAMRELEEKGVDAETVKYALEDFMFESKTDELAMAVEIARREVFGRMDIMSEPSEDTKESPVIDDKLVTRVARKLESRGFGHDDIYKVMSEMRRWDEKEYS